MPYRPISARADGLLSLLGIKNLGRNPDLLMESVQPVLDAQGWYLRSSAVPASENFVAAFASENFQATFLQAPDDTWLYVHYASGQAINGGGVAGPLVKFFVFRATPGVIIYETAHVEPILASGAEGAVVTIRDFWIPPSYGLLFGCDDLVVGTGVRVGGLVSRVQV